MHSGKYSSEKQKRQMNDIKLRLSLMVPGAKMLSREESLKNPNESFDESVVNVEYPVGRGKNPKIKKETLIIRTRKAKPVKQNINICSDGYRYMIDGSEPPTPKYAKIVSQKRNGDIVTLWSTMSVDQRLKVHLDLIAEHFNAKEYTYEVLDD